MVRTNTHLGTTCHRLRARCAQGMLAHVLVALGASLGAVLAYALLLVVRPGAPLGCAVCGRLSRLHARQRPLQRLARPLLRRGGAHPGCARAQGTLKAMLRAGF